MPDPADLYAKALKAVRHDARNILAGLSVLNDRLQGTEDERSAEFASILVRRVESLVELTKRADALAGVTLGEKTDQHLFRLIEGAFDGAPESIARIDVRAPRAWSLYCDAELTRLVLREVICNALEAAPEGVVAVDARREDNGDCILTIEDDAGGIAKTARGHLFTPFKGAKRKGQSGLGLPLADAALRVQGGSLTLMDSESDAGTLAILTLPGRN
ncbi:MAG: HAMP domain-containing histidine kinase [Parvularculaceae bacterium]|nr:HAMP domain-containing histidine kinase [Parvularculaceae bacterium]